MKIYCIGYDFNDQQGRHMSSSTTIISDNFSEASEVFLQEMAFLKKQPVCIKFVYSEPFIEPCG